MSLAVVFGSAVPPAELVLVQQLEWRTISKAASDGSLLNRMRKLDLASQCMPIKNKGKTSMDGVSHVAAKADPCAG